MRMLNQLKISNRIKKSHVLLIGSLLVFLGFISLSWNYLLKIKDEIYSDMRIAMMDKVPEKNETNTEVIGDVPVVQNVDASDDSNNYVIDYSKYLGVLEIPKIGLKRGFYGVDSKYNNIEYNVTMVEGSTLPDVQTGNLILMAHSGDAYISYFAYLYKLGVGDMIYVTYQGVRYEYQLVNIYEVPKNGVVTLRRDYSKTSLTLITCTKNNDATQSIYVSELVG